MFNDPIDQDSSVIEDGKYICKVVKLEGTPASAAHPEWGPGIKWTLHLADFATQKRIDGSDGEPYDYWLYTSAKLTPRSPGRPYVEALLGRPLTPTDRGAALAEELIGKKAVVMIGPKTKADGTVRAGAVLAMMPLKQAVTATPAKSAAVAVLEDDMPPAQNGEAF